jgi:hypothetical protein
MSMRNQLNHDTYMIMSNVIDKYDEPPLYWENMDTRLCAYAQMLNASDEEPVLFISDDSNNCCAMHCEFGCGVRCRIRESMWTCK